MHLGHLTDAAEIERAATDLVETEVPVVLGHDASRLRIETIIARDSAAAALVETSRGTDLLVVGRGGLGGSVACYSGR